MYNQLGGACAHASPSLYRIKREEDRIARELAEKELQEAEALLERMGKKRVRKDGEKLDKQTIMAVSTAALTSSLTYTRQQLYAKSHVNSSFM
jgi:hypothetical protein